MISTAHRVYCRSCSAAIAWATTPTGKSMPVDVEPVDGGNVVITDGPQGLYAVVVGSHEIKQPAYVSHFATCPNAAAHRKARL